MQVFPWTVLSVFLDQGYTFIHENDYLLYQLWQLSFSSLPSWNPYIALLWNSGFTLMFLFFNILHFFSSWFIELYFSLMSYPSLSTCHTNYIISSMWRSYSNSTFSAVSLGYSVVWLISSKLFFQTVFYEVSIIFLPYIFLGLNYLPLVPLNHIVLFVE